MGTRFFYFFGSCVQDVSCAAVFFQKLQKLFFVLFISAAVASCNPDEAADSVV